jgi:Flp pilus assembly protein protease CpaA
MDIELIHLKVVLALLYVVFAPVMGVRMITYNWKRAFMWTGLVYVAMAFCLVWIGSATFLHDFWFYKE